MPAFRSRHPVLTVFGFVLLLLVIFILIFDWNWLRGPVERMASKKTERSVSLGHLDVKLGWNPVIELQGVRVGNMQGAAPAQMIVADQIDVAVNLRSLFGHDIVIPFVRLHKPDVHLLREANGRTNWTFGKPDKPSEGSVNVLGLSVDNGRIEYVDKVLDTEVAVQVATGPSKLSDSPLHRSLTTQLAFKGHYGKTPFEGTASTGDVLSLQDTGTKFPVLTKFTLNHTVISADGSVTDLLKPTAIDAQLSVAGPDMALLYPALPVALPSSPPYRFAGRFSMQGNTYAYRDFKGMIGKSDIAGNAAFTSRKPRPYLETKLASRYLDLDDLGPLIGANKKPEPPKTADGKPEISPKASAMMSKATGKVLPQTPFKLDKLNAMDTKVTLNVKKLRVPEELPLEDLSAVMTVDAGKLSLTPLKVGVAGGDIVARVTLDGHASPITVDADINIAHAKLAQLFPTVEAMKNSEGAIGAKIRLAGHGNSIADMLGSANGSLQLAMSGGTVSNLMMEAVGLDGGEIIKFLVRGDQQTPIRCAGASFNVADGLANSEVIVFDTGDTRVDGKGFINMKTEEFNVLLSPEPKDRSILSLRVPVRLRGTFAKPGYTIVSRELLLRGGAAVALGMINPFASLLALIETGPGTNTNCGDVFRATAPAIEGGKTKEAGGKATSSRKGK